MIGGAPNRGITRFRGPVQQAVTSNGETLKFNITNGVDNLGRLIKNNYINIAQLKDLMTTPPMTAEQHAAIMRKRIAHRRMIEEAKELKAAGDSRFEIR